MSFNHNKTLVRVNKNNQLVEDASISYCKESLDLGKYGQPGTEFDEIELIEGERMVSLTELMTINLDAYTESLRAITASLED